MPRPMTHDDAQAVLDLTVAAWGTDGRASGLTRIDHLIDTDPGGAWVTEDDEGRIDGAALALVREGLWGLSLLIVREDRQSAGRGRELMDAALAHGEGTEAGLIVASSDPRAVRSYWRAGHDVRPVVDATGEVRRPPPADPAVRPARWPDDRDLVDAASRAARGAAHGTDIDASLRQDRELLVHDDGGFVLVGDGRVVLAAGLGLEASGALCVRGEPGPLRPYLPSGAYL